MNDKTCKCAEIDPSEPRYVGHVAGCPLAPGMKDRALDFDTLREQSATRRDRWHAGADSWIASDWSNALAGEVGEACNVVKKIRRHETGIRGGRVVGRETSLPYNTPNLEELEVKLADEIADVILYADLLAAHFAIDVGEAVRRKFNNVSIAQGFPERL